MTRWQISDALSKIAIGCWGITLLAVAFLFFFGGGQ